MRRSAPQARPGPAYGWAAALTTVLLCGCAGPPVETTSVPTPQVAPVWRTDIGPATAALEAEWWGAFGDPALSALVTQAMANNTDIAVAISRVREARANARLITAQQLPSIDANLTAGRSRTVSAFGTSLSQTFKQPQAIVAYEVDLFGRLADSALAARNAYLASAAARDSAQLAVCSAVASGYINLLGLDARLAVAQQTVLARMGSLRIARSRTQEGYAPMLELQQAQAELEATVQIVAQLKLAIARGENALGVLTCDLPDNPEGPIARRGRLTSLEMPSVPEGLPSELLDRRPDIAQAAHELAASDAALSAQRRRFLPQVRLTASAGAAFSSVLNDPIALFALGGSILAPVFDGGRLEAVADAAGAQRDQAAFGYLRVVLGAFRETEDSLATVKWTDEQARSAKRQRDVLELVLRQATSRYREGYSPYLEQVDSQRGLLAAELSVVQMRAASLEARVQLYQAMGGGWRDERLKATLIK